ncbi:S41 family peptidase [Frisingicoccus sp.]|uniref:S41 family peptidase n=3 Tax=Frisingicoccus sp. TaxID=1918627 RepID=UPI002A81A2AD|nr:S41 family peptidase [Frisingicoccus sp.]MDY4835856.1 S41 family peptidase [Frisingicoccus sp.]MDY4922922.1 S41 family peptidase [Frisingicoccus sp.]
MNKKNIVSFIAGMAVMGVIGVGINGVAGNGAVSSSRLGERYEKIEKKLDTIDKTISDYYLNQEDIDLDQLEEGIYAGYVKGLDEDYTTYYTAEEFSDVMEASSGSYSGIGAYVSQNMNTGIITIVKPFEGSPAEKAGIQKEDILYKVEGEEVTGQDLTTVVARLKGEEGTMANITIYRQSEDKYIDLSVERAVVNVPTVAHQMLDNHIGYIQIAEFEEVTAEQFKEAVSDLQEQGMEKLIFDLRDNGGGLLDSVCDVLDTILPKMMLVYTEDKDGNRREEWAEDDEAVDLPMAVLINGNTASASEIFTGALKDYDKAEIIGTTSYGKGIVQSIIPFSDGSALKVTSSKYYTPSGICIHGVGIEPDQTVEYDRTLEYDNQLQAAIDYLNEK